MPTVLFADADRESRDVYAWLPSSYGFHVDVDIKRAGDILAGSKLDQLVVRAPTACDGPSGWPLSGGN
jgi:hypothetical protein